MPRFLVVSDVHTEFHRDGGFDFIESLAKDVDAVLLAGDIATKSGLDFVISRFCEVYPRVVMVAGNHSYYGRHPKADIDGLLSRLEKELPNFDWLNNETAMVGDQRIVGTTLWFRHESNAPSWAMNDFDQILDFSSWVYEENRKACEFLENTVRADDIVLTHYLPSSQCVHPKYVGSPLNAFFVCDMERLIKRAQPRAWVFGHTHCSFDFRLGATRMICNPYGYHGYEVNPEFDARKVISEWLKEVP